MSKVRFISWVLLLSFSLGLTAQTTRVKGKVTDADTGEPIPFASIYFDGTTIGISTDLEGEFVLETRSEQAQALTASIIGYESQTFIIVNGSFSVVNFRLHRDENRLAAATVRPDDRYLRSILDRLDRARPRHDPERNGPWQSGLYSKIELDLTHAEGLIGNTVLDKRLGFLLDYRDTSAVTGDSFIPVLLSETVSRRYHSLDPKVDREVITANRISGMQPENILRQFTGSHVLSTNFYRDRIEVFNLDIPSPAAKGGQTFYNYYLVDSLQVEGRKTYTLRFHPKRLVTSPVFDGELCIDAEDFGIRSVHADLAPQSNVNWVRHINIDIENRRLPDGRWFYKEEHLFMDFSLTGSDRLMSFLGNRRLVYAEPTFEAITEPRLLADGDRVVIDGNAIQDDAFWEAARPYALTAREEGIFDMADEVTGSRAYRRVHGIANMLITGYAENPRLGLGYGPWARTYTFNDMEGNRIQAGLRTTKEFSEKVRLGGYVAYGFKDRQFKGRATAEFMFRRDKTRKLTLKAIRDFEQLGRGDGLFSEQNIFNSLLARTGSDRRSLLSEWNATYEHEFNPSFNNTLELRSLRIHGNDLIPLIRPDGTPLESIASNQIHWGGRFSWQEHINRGYFSKTSIFTRYLVVTVDLVTGIKGITDNDCSFLRGELTFDWKVPAGAAGFGTLHFNGGAILGSVPYPLLKLHEGNQTYFLDKTAFSCMDYFEFASDRWATAFYEHNFNGFFLGKVPLVKRLKLREVLTVRTAWGILSDDNTLRAPVRLLDGMGSLDKPYTEVGAGLSNILRLFRVDGFWRLTHRRDHGNFTLNLGLDLDF